MRIGSILENQKVEKRIALTPEIVKKYISLGIEVCLSKNYGIHLGISDKEYLGTLLTKIKSKQEDLSSLHGYKPVFIKISPDEQLENLREICNSVLIYKLDGIICSNTTAVNDEKNGNGGLSGKPLKNKATEKLMFVKNIVKDGLPIIASGGVMSVSDYKEKIDAGADLVQIYTGFIFEGPELVRELVNL